MDKIIKVGLIGFGVGGQVFHAPFITAIPGLKLSKIRAARPEQVLAAKAKYSQAEIVPGSDEIINDPDIDLVVITTPNVAHFPLALQALEAGKHVVVDKPFTVTTAEADTLIAVASERNQLLSVFQSRRFDSDFKTVKKVIQTGLLGELVEMESRYDRFRNFLKPGAWREESAPGTGILYDLGSHLVDQALVLFGLPQAITADVRMQRQAAKAIDNFELILHYPMLKVSLKAGMLVKEPLHRFVLFGTQGSFVKSGMDVQEDDLKAGYSPLTKHNWGIEPAAAQGKIITQYKGVELSGTIASEKGNYAEFYDNVYNGIVNKDPLIVTPIEARNTIRIIELAMQSQLERRTVDYSFLGGG